MSLLELVSMSGGRGNTKTPARLRRAAPIFPRCLSTPQVFEIKVGCPDAACSRFRCMRPSDRIGRPDASTTGASRVGATSNFSPDDESEIEPHIPPNLPHHVRCCETPAARATPAAAFRGSFRCNMRDHSDENVTSHWRSHVDDADPPLSHPAAVPVRRRYRSTHRAAALRITH